MLYVCIYTGIIHQHSTLNMCKVTKFICLTTVFSDIFYMSKTQFYAAGQ